MNNVADFIPLVCYTTIKQSSQMVTIFVYTDFIIAHVVVGYIILYQFVVHETKRSNCFSIIIIVGQNIIEIYKI